MVVDREVVQKRLLKLEQTLRKLQKLSRTSWEEYTQNEILQDSAERNLHIAAQTCIDIGSHIIAERGYRPPSSYADIFTVLHEEGLIPEDLAGTMRKIAGFRNILVHDYLDVDPQIVYTCLQRLEDFQRFAEHVLNWL
ncbi:MAG: type VII toxin-antitoxin system HepT family RNase toxin [Desulfurispora sp.]|uniref:type VII toxin-antitoxin system HepT family RNase toxin n=1 Tax=Desulfurispora sp. TaxID=3014275 RepID=UPI00404B7C5B